MSERITMWGEKTDVRRQKEKSKIQNQKPEENPKPEPENPKDGVGRVHSAYCLLSSVFFLKLDSVPARRRAIFARCL